SPNCRRGPCSAHHRVGVRTRKTSRGGHLAFPGPKSGRQNEYAKPLQCRHTVCILVNCVGKAADEKISHWFAEATDAHPRSSGNGDQSLLAPTRAIPSPALGPATNPSPHLFRFSLRSRCTAMLAVFRTLIQTRHGPVGAIDLLRHDALGPKPARMRGHDRPIFGDVFVERDAHFGLAPGFRDS